MVTLYDFKTKRTIVLKDSDRVQRETLLRAGWVLRDTPAEPTAPIEVPSEKETPPPPVLVNPESPTEPPQHMGGIFEVSAKDQGGSPFVEVAAENEEGQNFLGENLEELGAPKSGDGENFGGSNFEGAGGSVDEGVEVSGVVGVTEADKEDLRALEEGKAAAVEVLPEPVEVKKQGRGRGRPAGSGKRSAVHAWEGNLPD